MNGVGIYCRVSKEERTKEQEYSSSIYAQIQMAKEYLKEQKEEAEVKVYLDDGVSGSHFQRAGFQRLLADVEAGQIDTVIFKDISRLGREHIDTCYYLEKYFPQRQIRVISLLDGYDSQRNTYDELLELKALLHDFYLRDTSRKIKAAIQAKRRQGEYTPKEPPFGYVKSKQIKNHLEIDEFAAEIVRSIFQMYLAGNGCTRIAEKLNERQLPSPAKYKKEVRSTGDNRRVGKGIWSAYSVRDILMNPVYTGAVVLQKYEKPSYKRKDKRLIPLEERELIADVHEAIISREEFDRAQKQRKNNRKVRGKHNQNANTDKDAQVSDGSVLPAVKGGWGKQSQ